MSQQISCVIVEDDSWAAEMAKQILHDHFDNVVVKRIIGTLSEATLKLSDLGPDFVLLDVNLPDGDAFDLLRGLNEVNFKVVFITSYDKYAIEAFKYSALDFLLKPYTPDQLVDAVNKVLGQLDHDRYHRQLEALLYGQTRANTSKKIVLKNLEAVHVVSLSDILYVSSDNNYSIFHLKGGKNVMVSRTLKSYDEKLAVNGFFRIHQSHLVNLEVITSIDRKHDQVLLTNNVSLPISQKKKKDLIAYIEKLQ